MIFRLSQKLARKLKLAPKAVAPPHNNPFADWSAHLFIADRFEYIILTNTPSLYSLLMLGKKTTDDSEFIEAAMTAMLPFMTEDGNEPIYWRHIVPETEELLFSKALNRSVTGSMNDLIFQAKFLLVEREMSPFDVSFGLNEVPMSALGYKNPREVFKGLRNGSAGRDW